ncbi:MAG TPA: PLP-dependent aspartate aminotransferase family protein [Pyrinomonadaceae bacterium]|jgi:cystathionine gamma-synthase/methionine-gamma-lyase|nr:PLP-dependent aspartate aminotransferase family protein [Pyrinomonadaceae bacterium]
MADQKTNFDIATELIHRGERTAPLEGQPTSTPIYAAATYTYESMDQMDKVFGGELPGYVYTRHGNPTVTTLEEALRVTEGGATARAYGSGMAALHAALFACELSPGAVVLASQDLYGATTNLLLNIFSVFGIKTVFADFSNLPDLGTKAAELKPRVLIAETISNPLLKVCDIDACARIAHRAGARLIIDNTFASPYLCQPLEHGADIVVHSLTKFLGGHADAMGGVAISRDEFDSTALTGVMKLVGGVLSPWEAHEILRGMKTLHVRMDRHCENAKALAAHLQNDARIGHVYFPGLVAEAESTVAARMLRAGNFGALISIELKDGSRAAAFRFMDQLRLVVRSTSLGDVFTSALHPATASHRDLSPARRRELGISDGLIRISVGIESANDIIADIDQALAAVAAPGANRGPHAGSPRGVEVATGSG